LNVFEASGSADRGGAEQSPRRLTTHQQAVLIHVLLAFPDENVGVCCPPSAIAAHNYAEGFLTIFKAINWVVDQVEILENLPDIPSGLGILANDGDLPSSAEALRDALRIYGIEAEIVPDESGICGSRNFVLAVTQG
jgi:hypothetical protein